ncbi:sensor histidine kinase [Croceitalea vernalis]|uniref:Sensor histidine kinase n=1 Tax=Croceitalea vernalis TaxID=3075599 RepID=A0ABU3BIM5_9FLAO|nr:sensor histidine kinase [Croceitalea sp. P007]MDT0622017.1 sensor histidine kinase [Croceitalea sp. P007]
MKECIVLVLCLISSFLHSQELSKSDDASQQIPLINKDLLTAEGLYSSGTVALKSKNYEDALYNFKLGRELAKKNDDEYLTTLGDFYLATYFYETKDIPEALTYTDKALTSFQNQNRQADVAKCQYYLGRIYRQISDFEKALFHSFEALRINETSNEIKEIANCFSLIGSIYILTGDLNESELNFLKALKLQEQNKNDKELVTSYRNLGVLNQKRGNYQSALNYFNKGLLKIEKLSINDIDILDTKAILLGNIGSTLRQQGKPNESLDFLFQALAIKKELKRDRSTAHTCNDIAETYIEIKRYDEAKKFALEAADLSKVVSANNRRWAYYLISKCDYALKNYKSSVNNFKIYSRLKDSIFTIQKATRFNELQIQYDTEKRDFQIEAQKKDITLLDTQNKLKSQFLWFGGIGLLSLFGFVLALKSRQKAKKDIQQQEYFTQRLIESQEIERTRVSKDLHDSVGQQLTFMKKKAQNLDQLELSSLANAVLEEVRSISRDLYPATLKQLGLRESIEQLLFDLDGETEMFFSVEIDDINTSFDAAETLNFYRFIQESVNNVLKHSLAKTLIVNIVKGKNAIEVLIKDNGQGFQTSKSMLHNSLGLKTMAERIRILKGSLSIKSKKEVGTTILVKIPV